MHYVLTFRNFHHCYYYYHCLLLDLEPDASPNPADKGGIQYHSEDLLSSFGKCKESRQSSVA